MKKVLSMNRIVINYLRYLVPLMPITYSYAQTNTFPTNGSTGIGTTSPSYNFQVQKNSNQPAIMIGGGYPGSPRLQVYGLDADGQGFMGLGTDMGGGPYEHSIYFPTGPENLRGKLTIGDYNGNTYNTRLSILQNGFVGIGTLVPSELFTIGKETPSIGRNVIRIAAASYAEPGALNTSSNGDKIILYDASLSGYDGRIGIGDRANFWMKSLSGTSGYGGFEWYGGSDNINPNMLLSGSGNLSIGTMDSKGYKLAVNGSAIATSVTVKANNNWPDYVFKPNYKPTSLNALKNYIDKNRHLPEIPSEKDVAVNGLNLGEMNKLLLKKVEELTIYMIEKDKQYVDLKKQLMFTNRSQQKQIDLLKSKLQTKKAQMKVQ